MSKRKFIAKLVGAIAAAALPFHTIKLPKVRREIDYSKYNEELALAA